jgi:signal transduction histidine kinase/ActR/RegA family two-component response regulator
MIRLSDRERLDLLLEAGRILDHAEDLVSAMRALARLAAGALGEICVIDLVADGGPTPAAVAHCEPERTPLVQELRRLNPPRSEDRAGAWEVVRTGCAELHAELPREVAALRAFREIGAAAAMVAPLRAPGQLIGAITVFASAERALDGADLRVLEELGARAGLTAASVAPREAKGRGSARDRERLLLLEKEARAAAEVAVHRISTLQTVTAALSEAVTLAQVADIIVRESVTSLGARTGTVHVVDARGEHLELCAQRGMTAAATAAIAKLPLDIAQAVVVDAVNAQKPVWIVGRDHVRSVCPEASQVGERDPSALAAIPLAVAGRVVGVLGATFDSPEDLDEDVRVFALALVRHCAQAIDRARLYEAERRANQRLTLLARAGELLSASIDYEATLDAVARVALPSLGDYCFFDVREAGGVRRILRARDEAGQAAFTGLGDRPAREPSPTRRVEAAPSTAALQRLAARPEDVPLLRGLGLASVITVPLAARALPLGALTLAFGPSGRRHTQLDVEMAGELAHRAAAAIENAVLHRAAREAMERAQEANRRSELASRSKDEFLGVVSHELRTPLNAVLGWSQLLRGACGGDPAMVTKGLRVIDKNARAQAKLIEDILDVSRIITGKLRLEPRPIELDTVIRAALEVVRPAADAKAIHLSSALECRAPVSGDPDRLQQVAWNLLANAVKFTPEGGKVSIRLTRDRGSAVMTVTDSGRGIEPDVLQHVFERFWQADSSSTRRHGGLGLGLAIVRHLVELHGGTVRAESRGAGHGAVFTVVVPVREDPAGVEDGPPVCVRESDPQPRGARLDGLHVLVVDDEADARELCATMLSSAGARVTMAASAAEALAALRDAVPDVLVSDIGMPGEDGHALLRAIRASPRLSRVPAIALTAYAAADDASRAVRAGFHTHIPKPAEPALLTAVIASLAGRLPESLLGRAG